MAAKKTAPRAKNATKVATPEPVLNPPTEQWVGRAGCPEAPEPVVAAPALPLSKKWARLPKSGVGEVIPVLAAFLATDPKAWMRLPAGFKTANNLAFYAGKEGVFLSNKTHTIEVGFDGSFVVSEFDGWIARRERILADVRKAIATAAARKAARIKAAERANKAAARRAERQATQKKALGLDRINPANFAPLPKGLAKKIEAKAKAKTAPAV